MQPIFVATFHCKFMLFLLYGGLGRPCHLCNICYFLVSKEDGGLGQEHFSAPGKFQSSSVMIEVSVH